MPVNLRLYQLSYYRAFVKAPIQGLWSEPGETLGEDLLGEPIDITLQPESSDLPPGEREVGRLKLPEWESGAEYLGVFVLSARVPPQSSRRVVMAAKDVDNRILVVREGAIGL